MMSDVSFRTKYSSHTRVNCHPGSREVIVFTPKFDAKGNYDLVPAGKKNLYAEIQSHADSCDIHLIMERFASGEVDVLSKVQGFYADFADMPSTYQEILNAVIAGEQTFNSLPVEIKDKFGHSFQRWLIEMEAPDFAEKMGFKANVPAPASGVVSSVVSAPDSSSEVKSE